MGKGKVYPSPAPGGETAEAVLLRLLPAAVLAMAAPLGAEGKEVLAYLVLASLRSSAPPTPARKAGHRPELGCGCFGCYTAYWSRWDGSPESDCAAIHRAIEAFDEHLAKEESSRHRKKRGAAKDKAEKAKALAAVEPPLPEQDGSSVAVASLLQKAAGGGEEEKAAEEATPAVSSGDGVARVEEERRRSGWGAVAGVLNWRGWGL